MGGNLSSSAKPVPAPVQKCPSGCLSTEQAVSLVHPIYYTKEPLIDQERDEALAAWKLVFNNKAPVFAELRAKDPSFPYALCTEYFYSIFFVRLIDVYPHAKQLFIKPTQRMRQSFLGSLSMILNLMEETAKFQSCLTNLAHVHNKIGIKSMEYGIVGEVIIYSLQKCVGDMSHAARVGWGKILSRMLDVILPVVVTYELENREAIDAQYAARMTAVIQQTAITAEPVKEQRARCRTMSCGSSASEKHGCLASCSAELAPSRQPSVGTVTITPNLREH